jgi:hypothetical protein
VPTSKNTLIAFLAFTTLAGGALAWRQYQELVTLRAAALNTNERADWQKRLWAAEKKNADLEHKIAAQPKAPAAAPETADTELAPGERPRGPRFDRGGFAALMDQPEMQRLVALQQKGALDARYAQLFKSLNLTPEQLERFKNLLVEKSTAMMDVLAAARQQGINPRSDRDAFQKLVADAQAQVDDSIRSALGDVGYQQYKNFEQTQPQRAVVSQLEQRLSYSSTPLSPDQANQLVNILASTSPATARNNNNPVFFAGAPALGGAINFGGQVTITDATINQSLGVLAAPQIDALKQLQQEQQAQAELGAAMRKQFQPNRGGGTPPPGGG